MASSAQNQQRFTTSAPPPTPSSSSSSSSHPDFSSTLDSHATDHLLSRLLHRLPPTLSNTPILRRRPSHLSTVTTTTFPPPPLISFPDLTSSLSTNLPSISQLGCFQLINHSIPSQLAQSAESASLSLFNLSHQQKHQHFPRNWPLGFDDEDEDGTGAGGESLFLDSSCSTESSELPLSSLREFTLEMEKVGLAVMEALSCAVGFGNPVREDPARVCSLMWISTGSVSPGEKLAGSGKLYPSVIGLHYQLRRQECSLLADSGWVSVSPETDSILVTIGDIAQVWSNGKLNKVRGKPVPSLEEGNNSPSLSVSFLMTLPLESTVSPLLPKVEISSGNGDDHHDNNHDQNGSDKVREQSSTFNSFSFEDYAWRVYHERDLLKDPLDRYRT